MDAARRDTDDEPPDEALKASAALLRKQQASLAQPSVCAMCGLSRSKKSLNRMLNHRMMLEAQHHMRKRGVEILFFHQARKQQLSAESPVCGTCYSLYLAEKELIQLEAEMARETGQHISADAGKLCFVTGILDAIQVRWNLCLGAVLHLQNSHIAVCSSYAVSFSLWCTRGASTRFRILHQGSFLMNDPDLLELLQAFENSCQNTHWPSSTVGSADGLSDGASEVAEDDSILVALGDKGSDEADTHAAGRQYSDTSLTKDAQGALITFRGGEAIQSAPRSQPYDIALPAALHQWRLMLFLDSLQDPPASSCMEKPNSYLLQLGLFGSTSPVVLPVPDERGLVRIRRMLIFYLFSKKPTVTQIFKEDLHFSLRPGVSSCLNQRTGKLRVQSAGYPRSYALNPNAKPRRSFSGDSEYAEQAVAVGSCSLGRLAGKRSVKNQTCVLLFEGSTGRCRLRITLGLHRDMQIPTQYVSVIPYHDAFLSQAPYCCSCPLPTEWLDCFVTAPNS